METEVETGTGTGQEDAAGTGVGPSVSHIEPHTTLHNVLINDNEAILSQIAILDRQVKFLDAQKKDVLAQKELLTAFLLSSQKRGDSEKVGTSTAGAATMDDPTGADARVDVPVAAATTKGTSKEDEDEWETDTGSSETDTGSSEEEEEVDTSKKKGSEADMMESIMGRKL